MAPRSMTGFGRGEAEDIGRAWTVEIRTVNHRFFDFRVKLPSTHAALEDRVKKEVNRSHERGRVEVFVQLRGEQAGQARPEVDLGLARAYYDCLCRLADELGLSQRPGLMDVALLRDVLTQGQNVPDAETEWPLIRRALEQALAECAAMRDREGASLAEELLGRLNGFEAMVAQIDTVVPQVVEQRRKNLRQRLDQLIEGVELDPARLAQEVAILCDRSDVTEELVRLGSHIAQMRVFLAGNEAAGRRMDFLMQEFLREVNTIASKISNSEVAHLSVEMKNEVEKMREQVQNIE